MSPLPITAAICERFTKEPRILAVYLLGSAANGILRSDSDIDLGLLLQPGAALSGLEINDLASELTGGLGRPVDIGIISVLNLIYARQCILTGKQVFCRDVFRAGLAAATLLGLAMQLDFERREIIHAYSA